ncbi:MAG TPA: oligosaccharide flippase family protein [Candidatus Sulfotelmatobacter sp.]
MSNETEILSAAGIQARIRQSIGGLLTGKSLKAKALRGGAWLGSSSLAEQAARFVRNLILVRLLAPSAFGTVAIVLSTGLVLQAFTEVGVREALVQNRRGAENEFVNAAWWMAFIRSLLVWTTLSLAAPLVARFYGNPELTPLLRIAVLGLVLEGAMSARAYVAIKDMKFSRWALISNGGGILGVVLTVVLSFVIRDVWALVIGTVSESAARCVLSYAVCPWLPSLHVDRKSLKDLFEYSKGVFGVPLLSLIFLRTDVFVLGKLLSAARLGLYTMGIAAGQVPVVFVSNLLYQISLSTLSQIQEDKARTNRVIIRITSLVAAVGAPALAFAYFCAGPVLTIIYGRPYAVTAGPLFVALCAALISLANTQITGVFYAWGMPGLHRRCVAAMAITMIVLVYPFSMWLGPLGAQLASLISITVGFGLQLERIHHVTGLGLSEYAISIARSAVPSAAVVVVCLAARLLSWPTNPLRSIAIGAVGCLVAYALVCIMLLRQQAPAEVPSCG